MTLEKLSGRAPLPSSWTTRSAHGGGNAHLPGPEPEPFDAASEDRRPAVACSGFMVIMVSRGKCHWYNVM